MRIFRYRIADASLSLCAAVWKWPPKKIPPSQLFLHEKPAGGGGMFQRKDCYQTILRTNSAVRRCFLYLLKAG